MRLVLGSYYLNVPGGAVTYFATVAEHLQRLGHDVTAFTREAGLVAGALEERGLVVGGPERLPEECDAVLVQDAACAYELAERFPTAPQVFVSHGAEFDLELPPQVPDVVSAIVVMNERVRSRVEASGLDAEVVRLRQPIDFNRFRPHVRAGDPPRRAVLLGNYLEGGRRDRLVGSLEDLGIEWQQLGRHGEVSADPASVLAEADIVVGYGRSILEGMSAGCAAYVYEFTVDGWVTPDSYARLEADGFAGTAFDGDTDPGRVERDLRAYDPGMGPANRELIGRHHSAFEHANELAALLGRLAPRRTPADTRGETARLVRLQWEAELRATHFQRELIRMTKRALDAEREAKETEARMGELKRERRYRLAQAMMAPLDRLRRRR